MSEHAPCDGGVCCDLERAFEAGRISELELQLATARADALEEAARVARKVEDDYSAVSDAPAAIRDAVRAIRALIGMPAEPRFTLVELDAAWEVAIAPKDGDYYMGGTCNYEQLVAALTGEK